MVLRELEARAFEELVERLDRLHGRRVNDPAALHLAEQPREMFVLLDFVRHARHLVAQVGPVDARRDHARLAKRKMFLYVAHHFGRGRRGEREHGRRAERFNRVAEREVGGPKVVPPFRDAVSLVYDDEVDQALRERFEKRRIGHALRRREDELAALVPDHVEPRALLVRRKRAVQLRCLYARLPELIDLILHQRDERRDDDGRAFQMQGRQLVAERLARARRHHRERVAPFEHGAYDLLLPGPHPRDAERPAHHAPHLRKLLRYPQRTPPLSRTLNQFTRHPRVSRETSHARAGGGARLDSFYTSAPACLTVYDARLRELLTNPPAPATRARPLL